MNCGDCLDFIFKERCLVCNNVIDVCKTCIKNILNILFLESVIDVQVLSWISIILKIGGCKDCILRGLYPDNTFNQKNIRISMLIKRFNS